MRILIDGDGCPVVGLAITAARAHEFEAIIFCDSAHVYEREGARTVTTVKGADSVDFTLVNQARPGDIVVTQDYGLAAMCLARGAMVLNQNGQIYDDQNIDGLLSVRHLARKARMSGGRVRGPAKRTGEQDLAFERGLLRLIEGDKL